MTTLQKLEALIYKGFKETDEPGKKPTSASNSIGKNSTRALPSTEKSSKSAPKSAGKKALSVSNGCISNSLKSLTASRTR